MSREVFIYILLFILLFIYLFIYSFVRLRRRYKPPGTDHTLCWIASLNYTVQHLLTVRSRAILIISPSSQVTHLSDFALSLQVFKPSLTGCYCIWGKNETTVAQRCNPNMKTMKLKRSLVESPLFIVMTFVECFWVPCLLIEYDLQDIFMIYSCYMHTVYLSLTNSW